MSEAMYHLGVPTTRALSLAFTGEDVIRDIMYNGNPQYEKGAVVIRTAESFLRFGHFELMFAQGEHELLQDLLDFTIENYFPEIVSSDHQKYKDFFRKSMYPDSRLNGRMVQGRFCSWRNEHRQYVDLRFND